MHAPTSASSPKANPSHLNFFQMGFLREKYKTKTTHFLNVWRRKGPEVITQSKLPLEPEFSSLRQLSQLTCPQVQGGRWEGEPERRDRCPCPSSRVFPGPASVPQGSQCPHSIRQAPHHLALLFPRSVRKLYFSKTHQCHSGW